MDEYAALTEAREAIELTLELLQVQPAWLSVPKPFRWHRCRPVSTYRSLGSVVDRCACGGIRLDGSPWMERNSRRG